jgi:hypothetical protein
VDILVTSTRTVVLAVLKLGALTSIEYVPGMSPTTAKDPVEELTVLDTTPVEVFVIVRWAPRTAAPEVSVIVPLMPFTTCALSLVLARVNTNSNAADTIAVTRRIFLFN